MQWQLARYCNLVYLCTVPRLIRCKSMPEAGLFILWFVVSGLSCALNIYLTGATTLRRLPSVRHTTALSWHFTFLSSPYCTNTYNIHPQGCFINFVLLFSEFHHIAVMFSVVYRCVRVSIEAHVICHSLVPHFMGIFYYDASSAM